MSLLHNRYKKTLPLFFVAALAGSCQYFDKQVPSKDALLEKELKSINWEQVDEMPSVPQCDSITDKAQRQVCFTDFLVLNIQQRLSSDTLAVLYPELDTIEVRVTIFPDSKVRFEPRLNEKLVYGKRAIDSILQSRLSDFPPVNPAIKRGIPVKTQFSLPVILNVQKK